MAASFYFYDLETSGFNPRDARIMQFAGQRTDMYMQPIGKPMNVLIKLTPDIVPDPDAVLVTGITPQATLADGVPEAEFLRQFYAMAVKPDTIFLGFNSVRFDDEFMRFLHYRNFYDAYEWHWIDACSRWDVLDVVRMTRALRPDGIEWPFASDGRPTNRLELLTAINKLDHTNAHDALSDVHATIAVAKLIHDKQPKLFDFLLSMRDKRKVADLVESSQPFVYTSNKYPSEFEKTTVVIRLAMHPKKRGALVYDLRYDPAEFLDLTPQQLADRWQYTRDESAPKRLPVKTLQFNRCPAVAPLGVLDERSRGRIHIDMKIIKDNARKIRAAENFPATLLKTIELLDRRQQTVMLVDEHDVDSQLYDGFIDNADKLLERAIRIASPQELSEFAPQLRDGRLKKLLPLYKARNFPDALTSDERETWENFCKHRLMSGGQQSRMAKYFNRLQVLAGGTTVTGAQQYLLEELQLYGQSIMPVDSDA